MKKRILVAQFKHETNSFCPAPADNAAFHARNAIDDPAVIRPYFRGVGNEISGYFDFFEKYPEDYELLPVIAYNAEPSGPVTKEIFDHVSNAILTYLKNTDPVDGVLLSLHGAMVSEEYKDGEGLLMELIRKEIGPGIPIIASLDLHANVTRKMADNATILCPFREYPHVDQYETGIRAAEYMKKLLEGEKIVMGYEYVDYLLPLFPTSFKEMVDLYAYADEKASLPGIAEVSLNHGFFPANFDEMGMSVIVLSTESKDAADALAKEIGDEIRRRQPILIRKFYNEDEVCDAITNATAFPVAIGDASDNPGAGGTGDTTHILRFLLKRGITGGAIAHITDPGAVLKCQEAGVGATLKLTIGGLFDPVLTGGPLEVEAKVRMITDGVYITQDEMDKGFPIQMGLSALIEVGGNEVILCSQRTQPLDAEVFRAFGIHPEQKKFLVVKSAVHYRASFGKFAASMMEMALPGYATPLPENLYPERY